jgi:hypothetical protein
MGLSCLLTGMPFQRAGTLKMCSSIITPLFGDHGTIESRMYSPLLLNTLEEVGATSVADRPTNRPIVQVNSWSRPRLKPFFLSLKCSHLIPP